MPKKKNTNDEQSNFPEKWNKIIKDLPEFKEIADSASQEDLKKIIVSCEGNIYTIDREKSNDSKLNSAKELAKEYAAPYRDAVKVQTAKIKYALYLLENRGEDLDNQD